MKFLIVISIAINLIVLAQSAELSEEEAFKQELDTKVAQLVNELKSLFSKSSEWPDEPLIKPEQLAAFGEELAKLNQETEKQLRRTKKQVPDGLGKFVDGSVPLNFAKGVLAGNTFEAIGEQLTQLVGNFAKLLQGFQRGDNGGSGGGQPNPVPSGGQSANQQGPKENNQGGGESRPVNPITGKSFFGSEEEIKSIMDQLDLNEV